jgi:hypothetical protein
MKCCGYIDYGIPRKPMISHRNRDSRVIPMGTGVWEACGELVVTLLAILLASSFYYGCYCLEDMYFVSLHRAISGIDSLVPPSCICGCIGHGTSVLVRWLGPVEIFPSPTGGFAVGVVVVVVVVDGVDVGVVVDVVFDVAVCVAKYAVLQRTLVEDAVAACTGVDRLLPVMGEEEEDRDAAGGGGRDTAGDVRSSVVSKSMVVVVAVVAACGLLEPATKTSMDGHLGECVASHRLPA